MDARTDGPRFEKLMDGMHGIYTGGFKMSTELRDAYWRALRDVPFEEVKAHAERLMASAKPGDKLPLPSQLRNSPAQKTSGLPNAAQLKAERDSMRRWRELKADDPVRFQIEWNLARAYTELASCEPGTIEHDEWLRDCQRWSSLRYAPRAEQEAAAGK